MLVEIHSKVLYCRYLSLSTNMIDRISNLGALSMELPFASASLQSFTNCFHIAENIKILALGRNSIKSLTGIEAVAETLEQLWISYNMIDKLKGVQAMKKLKILYMAHNVVKDWTEFARMNEVPTLEEICFFGGSVHTTKIAPTDGPKKPDKLV